MSEIVSTVHQEDPEERAMLYKCLLRIYQEHPDFSWIVHGEREDSKGGHFSIVLGTRDTLQEAVDFACEKRTEYGWLDYDVEIKVEV